MTNLYRPTADYLAVFIEDARKNEDALDRVRELVANYEYEYLHLPHLRVPLGDVVDDIYKALGDRA